jgi:hypothetical protein
MKTIGHFNASRVSPFGRRSILGVLMLVLSALCWSDGTSAQDLIWEPQQKIVGVGTSGGLSLALFDSDGNAWAAQQKIAGVGTSGGLSLALLDNQLYAAWKGVGDDPGIYWSSFDGNAWAAQQRIQGVGTAVGPSLAVFGHQLYAIWKGIDYDPGIYWSSFDGNAWAAQQKIAGVGTSGGLFGHQLYAVWRGVGNDAGIYWSRAKPILSVLSPLECERFVQGESIGLQATVTDPAGGPGNADSVS